MRLRVFALAFLAPLAGCLANSIIDSTSGNGSTVLPALESAPYDSLGTAKLSWQRFATTAGSFRGIYLLNGATRTTQSLLATRALDRAMQHPTTGALVYGAQTATGNSIFDLYTTRLSDSLETRLSSGTETEQYPSWSPNGSLIYYSYRLNGKTTVARQAPTAGAIRDTLVLVDSQTVSWIIDSPIAVNAAGRMALVVNSSGWRIWAVDFAGTNRVKLREDIRSGIGPIFQGVQWSPDGTKIAFLELNYDVADQLTSTTVKTMNPDGTGEVSYVTVNTLPFSFNATSLNDFSLCWLDATRIAFTALGNDRASHVYIVHFAGASKLTQVTSNSGVFDRGVSCRQ